MNSSNRFLLLQQVEGGGLGCLILESQVHAFMATILLGAPRLMRWI